MWGWRSGQAQEDEDDERCDTLMVRLQAEIEEAEARSPVPVWDGTSGLTKGSEEELAALVQAAADEERRLRSQAAGARGGGGGGGNGARARVGAAAGQPRDGPAAGGSSSASLASVARRDGSRSARGSPASGADPGSLSPLPPRPRSAGSLHRAGSAPPAPSGSRSASSSRPASPGLGPSASDSAVAGLGDERGAGAGGLDAGPFRRASGGDPSASQGSARGGPTGARSGPHDAPRSPSSLSGAPSAAPPAPPPCAPPAAAAPVRPPRPRTRAEAMAALRRVDLADVDAVWKALDAALDAEDAAAWGGRVRGPPSRAGAAGEGGAGEGSGAANGLAPPPVSAAAREEAALKRCLAKRDLRGAFSHAISGEGACPLGLGRDRRRFSLLAAVLRARRA